MTKILAKPPEPWYAAYYVTILFLATLALAVTIFDPDPLVGKFWLGVAVFVGWFLIIQFAVRDTLRVHRQNKQRQREYEERHGRDKEGT